MSDSRAKLSTFEQRVEWLINKKTLWYDMWYTKSESSLYTVTRKLINYMKRDGLFSTTTYWCDVKLKKELYAAAKIIRSSNA